MHKTVLLKETIDGLSPKEGDVIVDATLNAGGHTKEIFKRLGNKVEVIGIDADSDAIERANASLKGNPHFKTFLGNFRNLDLALKENGKEYADGFVFDLGLSSNQLDDSGRGFTFQKDEPLDMSFQKGGALSAKVIVNEWSEESIEAILKGFGEEQFARRIAKAIIEYRKEFEIETTGELVEIIRSAVPAWYRGKKTNPATKTFQALRIAVNDETGALEEGLRKAFLHLRDGGRISIISFHSIEDRMVKNFFKKLKEEGKAKLITKKPIVPEKEELKENPRSRSAKLRVVEKIKS